MRLYGSKQTWILHKDLEVGDMWTFRIGDVVIARPDTSKVWLGFTEPLVVRKDEEFDPLENIRVLGCGGKMSQVEIKEKDNG